MRINHEDERSMTMRASARNVMGERWCRELVGSVVEGFEGLCRLGHHRHRPCPGLRRGVVGGGDDDRWG